MKKKCFVKYISGQVPCQVFTKNILNGLYYEKYKSILILYPINYQ